MLTNNFIESWHNQLKALYLKHTRNKRLDRLIFILTYEVESYFDRECERILSNSGRMAPLENERARRMYLASLVPVERLSDMLTTRMETTTAMLKWGPGQCNVLWLRTLRCITK